MRPGLPLERAKVPHILALAYSPTDTITLNFRKHLIFTQIRESTKIKCVKIKYWSETFQID